MTKMHDTTELMRQREMVSVAALARIAQEGSVSLSLLHDDALSSGLAPQAVRDGLFDVFKSQNIAHSAGNILSLALDNK